MLKPVVGLFSSQQRAALSKRRWGVDTQLVMPREKVRKGVSFSISALTFFGGGTPRLRDGKSGRVDNDADGGDGDGCL